MSKMHVDLSQEPLIRLLLVANQPVFQVNCRIIILLACHYCLQTLFGGSIVIVWIWQYCTFQEVTIISMACTLKPDSYASRRSRTRDTVKLTVCVCVSVCVSVCQFQL